MQSLRSTRCQQLDNAPPVWTLTRVSLLPGFLGTTETEQLNLSGLDGSSALHRGSLENNQESAKVWSLIQSSIWYVLELEITSPRPRNPRDRVQKIYFYNPPGHSDSTQSLRTIVPGSVQFSRSVVSDSLRPHESQHAKPPCPSPTAGVHSDSRLPTS